jgi:hypothetical protein
MSKMIYLPCDTCDFENILYHNSELIDEALQDYKNSLLKTDLKDTESKEVEFNYLRCAQICLHPFLCEVFGTVETILKRPSEVLPRLQNINPYGKIPDCHLQLSMIQGIFDYPQTCAAIKLSFSELEAICQYGYLNYYDKLKQYWCEVGTSVSGYMAFNSPEFYEDKFLNRESNNYDYVDIFVVKIIQLMMESEHGEDWEHNLSKDIYSSLDFDDFVEG